jgi:hypothetical protein
MSPTGRRPRDDSLDHGCFAEEVVGSWRLLKVIAPRLSKVWQLPGAVSSSVQDLARKFSIGRGCLEWKWDSGALLVAFQQAKASLAEGGWVAQQHAMYFVTGAVNRVRFGLTAELLRVLFEVLEAMASSARAEVREGAVPILGALIPLSASCAAFYEQNVKQRSGAIAVASGLAHLTAIEVIGEIEPWAPETFEFLAAAHSAFKPWATAIEAGFNTFWKGVGFLDIPKLDSWRYAFAGGYFS